MKMAMGSVTIAAACLTALLALAAPAAAHNEYRIIGTVEKMSPKMLAVKQSKDGKVIAMEMDDSSIVTRDKKKVAMAELKAGVHVVVTACGDAIDKLLVMEVRIVPPPPKG